METGTEVIISPEKRSLHATGFVRARPIGGQQPDNFRLLGAFTGVYFVATGLLAWHKPLWYDELFTLHLCRLPRLADLGSALAQGTDLNPPLYFLAARSTQACFGQSAWALRLPAVVGLWVMSLCLFRFVSRRCTPLYSAIAMVFPLAATFVYSYAYEARPYGLALGFCGLSLVSWQAAADGKRRILALPGLALSLAGAFCTHYYAILVLFPLALGELLRSLTRQRLDLPVWLAFGAAVLPLGLLLPCLEQARTYAPHFWARPSWEAAGPTYMALLTNVWPSLLVLLIVLVFYPGPTLSRTSPDRQPVSRLAPPHELAVAIGLVALPVLGIALGKFITGAFTVRYVLPAVFGFGILLALASYRRLGGSILLGRMLLLGLMGLFVVGAMREGKRQGEKAARLRERCAFLERHSTANENLAVASALVYLELVEHGSPALVSRLVYVSDVEAAVRYSHQDTSERALRNLRHWAPLNVLDYGPFVAKNKQFLVYGKGWLRRALKAAGADLHVRGRDRHDTLWAVARRPR